MQHVRGLGFLTWVLMACSVQADTIPTLTATSAYLNWATTRLGIYSSISGADFFFDIPYSYPLSNITYPCSLPLPAGGCVAPGPALFFQDPGSTGFLNTVEGFVALGGTEYPAFFAGNAQIQYSTPTIVYPDPTPTGNTVNVPVVLSGSVRACLMPQYSSPSDPCVGVDALGRPLPGYPNYLADISISLPGTLTLSVLEVRPGFIAPVEAYFNSTPVPEPGSVGLACIGFFLLLATGFYRRRRMWREADRQRQ